MKRRNRWEQDATPERPGRVGPFVRRPPYRAGRLLRRRVLLGLANAGSAVVDERFRAAYAPKEIDALWKVRMRHSSGMLTFALAPHW